MREICESEANHCVNDMRAIIKSQGGASAELVLKNHFNVYNVNTLWLMMSSKRHDADDKQMRKLLKILSELFASIDMMGTLFSHFPILCYLAPETSGYKFFIDAHNNFHEFVGEEIAKHREVFNPCNEPQDLIDSYLQMIDLKENSNNNNGEEEIHESFTEKQMSAVILDMFLAGSETTNKSTNFMFLHLVRNKSIQEKAREEIDRVVGRSRLPSLDDKMK
jgi:cytochrome P450